MARKKPRASVTRRNHRTIGAVASVFVMFMVLSGLALNHSNGLGLDQRHVSQSLLLHWYGIGEPEYIHSFAVRDDWLSFAGSQLYFNDINVATMSNGVGAVSSGDLIVAAGSSDILLLNLKGQLIERLPWDQFDDGQIESLGLLRDDTVALKSSRQLWLADAQLLNWRPSGDVVQQPAWSAPAQTPKVLRQAITQNYQGDGLSLEQLILDLHSGRIFGQAGVIVYDLLALILGFLAVSGLILWLRGRRNGKRSD